MGIVLLLMVGAGDTLSSWSLEVIELVSSLFQGSGLWAAIAGPLFYLIIVGPTLGVIVFLLAGKRKSDD